jgi:hypothetical protein
VIGFNFDMATNPMIYSSHLAGRKIVSEEMPMPGQKRRPIEVRFADYLVTAGDHKCWLLSWA